ncbi:hypothetical protein STSP2_02489 [Anaerohalosphaera lusitana]|uniref:Uncharacterized protein n=1 Tax=Anaerohalosphaera lusitana TaxID=1936003 RepID=A0A1U9NNW1_9BACT|nr:hypothetical protein STSP2_02489 [Anaerohalosphaera lusitana]
MSYPHEHPNAVIASGKAAWLSQSPQKSLLTQHTPPRTVIRRRRTQRTSRLRMYAPPLCHPGLRAGAQRTQRAHMHTQNTLHHYLLSAFVTSIPNSQANFSSPTLYRRNYQKKQPFLNIDFSRYMIKAIIELLIFLLTKQIKGAANEKQNIHNSFDRLSDP